MTSVVTDFVQGSIRLVCICDLKQRPDKENSVYECEISGKKISLVENAQ